MFTYLLEHGSIFSVYTSASACLSSIFILFTRIIVTLLGAIYVHLYTLAFGNILSFFRYHLSSGSPFPSLHLEVVLLHPPFERSLALFKLHRAPQKWPTEATGEIVAVAPAVETAVEVAVEAEEAIVGITAVVEAEAAMIVETMAVAEAGEATVETMAVAEVGEETMAVAGAEEIAVAFVAASVASGETVPEVAAEEDGEGAVTPLPGSQRCSGELYPLLWTGFNTRLTCWDAM